MTFYITEFAKNGKFFFFWLHDPSTNFDIAKEDCILKPANTAAAVVVVVAKCLIPDAN